MNLQDARQQIPEISGLSDDMAVDVIRQVYYPDMDRADLADRLGVRAVSPPAPKRTWGQAAGDTMVQLAEGVNTTLGAVPSIVAPDGEVAGFFRNNAEYWRDKQSEPLKQRISESDQRIRDAGKDSVMAQIGTAASEYWDDPTQAARLVATNLPSMAATLGVGAGAGVAAKAVAAGRGLDAASKAALAAKYGTTTAAATNAALNAGGARGEAYDDLLATALAQGMTQEQAQEAALSGSVLPGVVGGVAGAVSGKLGLEKAVLGQAATGSALRKGAGALGAELAGEQIEELAPKVATNYEAGQIDPGRSLTNDVGRTVVETAIGSGPGAVVAGGAAGLRTPMDTTQELPVPVAAPSGPITKALDDAIAKTGEAFAPLAGDQPETPAPVDDPVRDHILAMPDGARQDALRAYAVVSRNDVPKGVQQYNRKLLDQLLAEHALAAKPPTASAESQLSLPEKQELARAMVRAEPVDAPLAELQNAVRDGTGYTSPATVAATRQAVEDSWLRDNVQPTAAEPAPTPGQDTEALGQAIAHTDGKVRERRILSALQNLVDGQSSGSATVIKSLDASLAKVGEAVLSPRERQLVRRLMDSHAAFTGKTEAAPLPMPEAPAIDANADNSSLEALIPERKAKPPPEPQPAPRTNAGIQDGDAMNRLGKPFTVRLPAINAAKKAGEGNEVVAVKGGFVVRKKAAAVETAAEEGMKMFGPETGTLGIPRAEMPQVPTQSHGGLVKHLNAQGIAHETTTVDAASLKPTQAEYSPAKVERAKTAEGDRSVIVSSDGRIIDGHHQALAAAEDGKPVKAIVLDAPVEQALEAVRNSPSAAAPVTVDANQEASSNAETPASRSEKKPIPLSIGRAPGNSDPVMVKDGTVFVGKYEALNYDSGEPVTVPKGSTRGDVARALKESGALGSGQKVFGLGEQAGDVMFKRGADAGERSRISVADVEKEVSTWQTKWKNMPLVKVVESIESPEVPSAVREERDRQKGRKEGEPRGVFHDDTVYLIADQLPTARDAAITLFHEVLGHAGLRGAFGDALTPILEQIAALRRSEINKKAQEYGLDVNSRSDRLIAAEEVLAEWAQSRPDIGYVRRAVAAIRQWLRAHMPGFKNLALTDNEIVANYLLPARGWVERGRTAGVAPTTPSEATHPAFSIAERVDHTLKSIASTNLKQQAGFKATDYRSLGLGFLGRRQLVDVYGDMLPELRTYSDLMARMDADKNEGGAKADKLAQDWAKLPDERALAELMHDSTLAQIDPSKDFVEGDNKAEWNRLRARHNALTPGAKDTYALARDTHEQHMRDVRSAMKERIERAEVGSERKAALLKRMDDEFFGHIKGVYFPLARFGQYLVVVKDAEGQVANVSRAETMAEADATRRQLVTAFPSGKGFTVGKVLKAKDFVADRDAVGRGFMEQLYGVIDKQGMDAMQRAELEDALGQLYLSSLPDLSWAKHGIHRKGTPGFSQDARRAFAQNVFHGASYLAKLRYGDQLQEQLSEMQKRVDAGASDAVFDSVKAQQLVDEMVKRHDAAMNPKTNALSTALTSFGFLFHLGLSPASAMVNLTQTALVAYPIMGARWGFAKSSAALLKASGEAARGKNDITSSLSAEERAAFDEAVRSGVVDVTMAHDLAGIAQGEDRNVSYKLRPVMRAASFLFHHAEKFNRQVTFVASYRLAREAGADDKAAYEQAVQATYDGHFDYSANNRPRVMQGNVARVVLLFKQYGQNMVYTLARNAQQSLKGATPEARAEARKALGGLLVTHGLASGVLGLPMVTTLLAAASMLGGDDDEPWDAEVALRNMLADTFGHKAAEVMARGLSRLTPWDISGRVGLDKLIFPDVQEGLEGQRLAESAMTAALGPVAGIGVNLLKGLQEMSEGRYARGLETMAPSMARGPLKALRYGNEGVRDKSGVVVQDEVGVAELLGQAAGFSPSSVRNSFEGKSAIVQHDRALVARRSALIEQFAMASMAKDEPGKSEARQDIAKFNEKNPGRRIAPGNLMQSVRTRVKRIQQAQNGVYLPVKRRDAMGAGRFAADE
jgi:hypothetical protein